MKSFILASVAASAMALSEIESAFLGYITQFGKSYSSVAEYEMRLRNFAVKHAVIEAHNETGEAYKLGHNKMSDWSEEEYNSILTYQPGLHNVTATFDEVAASTPVDWRQSACLQPIQDQGQCGSCWAFSSVASLESAYCIANNNTLLKLSEQQLVDCVKLCFGCNGGNASLSFHYYKDHLAMSEASYPYTAMDGTCNYNASSATVVQDTGYTAVTKDSPDAMKAALANQPLSVAIQANQLSFQLYSSGVFTNTNCGTNLDHATNVVGWGNNGTMDYWIMRNSWGTSWGMAGYMELEIVPGVGLCGIQMEPLFPLPN
jgi:C1A family cysteine protease